MTLEDTLELLSYAADNHPPYFDPGTEVEVYSFDEETWEPLAARRQDLPSLIEEARNAGFVDQPRIQFRESEAKKYLQHLKESDIDPQLHYDDTVTRERLVALADEGYTSIEDLLGDDDPIDISKATRINRGVITSLAAKYLDAFSTGTEVGEGSSGPLAGLEPRDDFEGWDLIQQTSHTIRWATDGGFSVTLTPTAGAGILVRAITAQNRRSPRRDDEETIAGGRTGFEPEAALDHAHDWLSDHQFRYIDDLTSVYQVGPVTRDYLAFQYRITSEEALRSFAKTRPDAFDDVFAGFAEDVRADLGL